ncbi:hypothetical protein EDC04DRAFT_3086539 [Pisolithus marmoratus]|nr:hypothetical protein EDC04DRAFT_3086539 [Pisolithus marmoratus]
MRWAPMLHCASDLNIHKGYSYHVECSDGGPTTGNQPFTTFLTQQYPAVKEHYPGEGRRRWRLRVAEQFWRQCSHLAPALQIPMPDTSAGAARVDDSDPLDCMSTERPELGLIVRTDFSNEDAWSSFCSRLAEGEEEFVQSAIGDHAANDNMIPTEQTLDDTEDHMDESDDDDDECPPKIFYLISPSSPEQRASLSDISNLTVLRLLNDVEVRPAPSPSQGIKRIKVPNRLVDFNGWQEIYTGKQIWIYDSKSNLDQCVRLVSHSGNMYGTATGDSWRARVSHICELQVHIASGTIRIDFGGLDRWDGYERQRNMAEAEQAQHI